MRLALVLSGVLAAVALLLAVNQPLAEVPVVGLANLAETSWGGGHRFMVMAALAFGAALAGLSVRSRHFALLLAALALGMFADVLFSANAWYGEAMASVKAAQEFGGSATEIAIRWKPGAWYLGGAGMLLVLQTILALLPSPRAPAKTEGI